MKGQRFLNGNYAKRCPGCQRRAWLARRRGMRRWPARAAIAPWVYTFLGLGAGLLLRWFR